MSAPANTHKKTPPQNVLYRSRIEICHILQKLAKAQGSISADIKNGGTFISHILLVDSRAGHFVISYCANKFFNSKLLTLPSLKFTASYQDAHLVFEARNPTETQFEDDYAIQFALPKVLILYHRRDSPRLPVPTKISLRCIADAEGFAPFESYITDISHDGFGSMIYSRDIKLEAGTALKSCRIITPASHAIIADLELRHIKKLTLPDGKLVNHASLRFIQRPDEIAELINFYIQDLDKK